MENQQDNSEEWKNKLVKPPVDTRPKTEDVTATKGHDFEDYGLNEKLMMGIIEKGFDKPSPV